MSLLDDIRSKPYQAPRARVLLHGMPGTGKTTTAASIAALGKTLYLYVQGEEGIGSLDGLSYGDNLVVHKVASIPELEQLYTELEAGDHDYDAVVFESVSALYPMIRNHILGVANDRPVSNLPAIEFAFWSSLGIWYTNFFTFWYALADPYREHPMHIVMTSQTKMLDDAGGDAVMQPDLPTTPRGVAVSRADLILFTHMGRDPENPMQQKHLVRIKPSSSITAKTRVSSPEVYESLPELLGLTKRFTLPTYLKAIGVSGVDTP
jgi:hypothetical protein